MDSAQLRRQLVAKLLADGQLRSPRIAHAFASVPRELFVPGLPLAEVYRSNEAILVKRVNGIGVSSASAPDVMALMLEQLAPRPGDHVLEIGAGTGYNAALLAHLVGPSGSVVSVDIDAELVPLAREHLQVAGYPQVKVVEGDGALGYAAGAPYDRVMLTVASRDVAPAWREQLAPHGRLLMPLAIRGSQRCVAFERADGHLVSTSLGCCAFIPLRGVLAMDTLRIPLDSQGAVTLGLPDEESPGFDAAAVLRQLQGPLDSLRSGVHATPDEVRGGLQLWLAGHEPSVCSVWAEVSVDAVPELFGQPERFRATLGVLVDGVLAVLAWGRHRHELCVLSPPGGTAVAAELCQQLRNWHAAGRPTDAQLHIAAYPRDAATPPGGTLVDQRWTRFDLRWQSTL
jgi:protein-L-isoaspartate(D-aspartate) O-methyltransferase